MKSSFSTSILSKSLILLAFVLAACSADPTEKAIKPLLQKHIDFLASDTLKGRATGSPEEEMVVTYISHQFELLHLKPAGTDGYLQSFYVKPSSNPHEKARIADDTLGTKVTNTMGLLDNPGDGIVIIGAHHDHLGMGEFGTLHRGDTAIHNGADDNASGVAIVLALAAQLIDEKLNADVLFMTFSGEERGLWGSNHFAKNPTIDLSNVKAMINLDMVGRLNTEKKLVVHGTGTSPTWPEILEKYNLDSLDLIMKPSGVGPSDHTSFYLQDIPVLHLFTGQHEDYHKPGDDADKLNYEGMEILTEYLKAIITTLDHRNEIAFTPTKDESGNTPRFKVSLGVVPDYLFDGKGMRIDGVTEGKPASIAGIEKGDIVVAMGDSIVTDMMSYMRALSVFEKGDSTQVVVNRKNESLKYDIKFQ